MGVLAGLLPAGALAAHGYRVSLAAAPNPDVSGDPLTIIGTLSNSRGRQVQGAHLVLYHRVNPVPFFSPIQRTRSGPGGFFQINRAEGVVVSNREWYIVARGPGGRFLARSPIVRERVFAILTLASSTPNPETGQTVLFTGTVSPRHTGERVILERQTAQNGNGWRRIGVGRIEAGGTFSIAHRFLRPSEAGAATIRAVLPDDARNLRSFSEPLELTIHQAENTDLTLSPSAPTVVIGEPVTLSGKLLGSDGSGLGGQAVTLYGREAGGGYHAITSTSTAADGSFSFVQVPTHNTAYVVRAAAGKESAPVFEGVHDTVTASASATSGTVGQVITIAGLVVPDHAGHIVYLQLRNVAGRYQTIEVTYTGVGSTYAFSHQLQSAGVKDYRVYIPGGPYNLGGASTPFSVNVSPAASPPMLEPTPVPED
jgi:hypothetical protein